MTVKVDVRSSDVEKQNGTGVSRDKEDRSSHDSLEKEKIVSLYLAQQGTTQEGREKFRAYLENSETLRSTRRRQIFKQYNHPKEDVDVDTVDYSLYHKRDCVSAVPKTPNSDLCGCNKLLSHPQHKYHLKDAKDWDYTKDTELHPTDAYGRVKFSSWQKAKYVRVDADSNPGDIANLVQNVFNLQIPGVIISLKGSLLDFCVTSKVEKVIQRGIMKAAITTNGWLTTSGIDAGCVISIGEALRMHNHTVPCIGFSSWGCLPEVVKEALTVPLDNGEGEYICSYPKIKVKPGSSVENLEANHSHHILSDTGGISDWGTESTLRANWEAHMRDELNIPVVMVVMQGSIGASQFLLEGLRAGTPAVVINGSGGVCDVIVSLVRHLKSVTKRHSRSRGLTRQDSRKRSITEHIEVCSCSHSLSMTCPVSVQTLNSGTFDKFTKEDKKFLENIYEIVTEYEDLLILFDLNDDNYDGLDGALLEALVKAQNVHDVKRNTEEKKPSNNLSGVQVALGWNRPDFAERLLKADNSCKDELALGSILLHAMAWNLHEFTELLLNHDASIPMVAANAVVLYNSSKNNEHLNRFVRYSLRGKHKSNDLSKEVIDNMINKLASNRNNFASDVTNESDPYFEVMVWAALSLYPEIAYLMWKGTQEPIRAALFVVMLLKRLRKAKKVIINANDKNIIDTMLDDFEVRAIAILDTLHETDSTVCERALNSVWERLGNKTYIDMAHKCRAREFIAHPACQEICEYRWKRGLNTEVNIVSVTLTTLCPLLLFTGFISFRSEVTRKCTSAYQTFITKIKIWFKSPNVKFWSGVVTYIIFVLFQTHVVFTLLGKDKSFPPSKIVYLVWFGMLVVDELLQIGYISFKDWLRNMYNKVDTIMYLAMIVGIVLVHIPDPQIDSGLPEVPNRFYDSGRIFLSLGSILFYVRLLHMFSLDSALGPTILMITQMMGDFRVFLVMFFVVAVAFGVGYAVALTDPEDWMKDGQYTENTGGYIAGIFFYTYFQMFGEIFAEDLSETGQFFKEKKESSRHGYAIGLVGVYMAIVVLMLVNILIAMFSDTYTRIKDREDVIFKFQRLELLLDVENSLLPPPFSFPHILISMITNCSKNKMSPFCHDRWKDTVIRSAVVDCLEDYIKKERSTKSTETEALLKESTRTLKNKLFTLQRYVENLQNSVDSFSGNPHFSGK